MQNKVLKEKLILDFGYFGKYFIRNISKYLGAADLSIATAVSSRLQNAE